MKFSLLILFCFLQVKLYAQCDSLKCIKLGFESGYFSYGSVDELFTPFVYSGNSAFFNLSVSKESFFSRHSLSVKYASIERSPLNIDIPGYYNVISFDSEKYYKVKSESYLRTLNTKYSELKYTYFRKTKVRIFSKNALFVGFCSENSLVVKDDLSNSELLTSLINPGIHYELPLQSKTFLVFESYFTLVGLNLRKPYAGASAQLSDNYTSSSYFWDYIDEHLQLNFPNSCQHFYSKIQLERLIYKRIILNFNYQFSYFSLQYPRNLKSVTNIFGLGFTIKFWKNAK